MAKEGITYLMLVYDAPVGYCWCMPHLWVTDWRLCRTCELLLGVYSVAGYSLACMQHLWVTARRVCCTCGLLLGTYGAPEAYCWCMSHVRVTPWGVCRACRLLHGIYGATEGYSWSIPHVRVTAWGVCRTCGLLLGVYGIVAALTHAHGPQRSQPPHGRLVTRATPAEHRAALAAVVPPLQRRKADLPNNHRHHLFILISNNLRGNIFRN